MNGLFIARRAGGSDVPAMFRIYNTNLDEYFATESVEFFMLQWPQGQFVADSVLGGTVGSLSGCRMEDGSASIMLLAVDAGCRSGGAGTALIEAFIRECRMEGIPRIRLETRIGNANARRFYSRFGFRVTETVHALYSDGGDGVRMVLDLIRV